MLACAVLILGGCTVDIQAGDVVPPAIGAPATAPAQGFIANAGMLAGWTIIFEPGKDGTTALTVQGTPMAQK
jgi:hypothetical protein